MIGISSFRLGRYRVLLLCLAVYTVVVLTRLWRTAEIGGRALLVPLPVDKDFDHFRRSRSLRDYTENIQVLIEPSSTPCDGPAQVVVLVLVTSAPARVDQRAVIRSTWGKHQPTFFVLGVEDQEIGGNFADIYLEAKEYGDMVVFDIREHYQNLTLKTAMMLQWTMQRCPQIEFLFKTDDDVFVNPWMLKEVLKDNKDAQLVGYTKNNSWVHRDEYNKWFVPRWLLADDWLPQYLSGTGYLVSGEYVLLLLNTANTVPLLNLEDVYFTYLVAVRSLSFILTHDRRLNPYKPWFTFGCAYYNLASAHSLSPPEMKIAWDNLENIVKQNNKNACKNYLFLSSDWLLY